MKIKKAHSDGLKTFPLGRAMQVAGYLALALAVIHAGRVVVESIAAGPFETGSMWGWLQSGLLGLVQASPYLFLLSGLVAVARLGKLYDEGIVFSAENARLVARFGDALAWTAAAMLLIRPALLEWIAGATWGLKFRIDEGGLITLVAAVFVSGMAKVMQQATKLEHENQQFV